MKNRSFRTRVALLIAAAGTAAAFSAQAEPTPVSIANCQPYYMGYATSPQLLRYLPSGIANASATLQGVMCPLPKKGVNWHPGHAWSAMVFFRKDANLPPTAPVSANFCTLYVGSAVNGGMKNKTLTASEMTADYSQIAYDENNGPEGQPSDAATLICAIAPHYVLETIFYEE